MMISEMEIEGEEEADLPPGFPLPLPLPCRRRRGCGDADAELGGALCALVQRAAAAAAADPSDPRGGWTAAHWAARFGKGQGDGGRKRLLDQWENLVNKRARTESETRGLFNGSLRPAPWTAPDEAPPPPRRRPPPAAQPSPGGETPGHASDMCGLLHRSGSPAPPAATTSDLGGVTFDLGDLLLYGHLHGYGDTAEDIGVAAAAAAARRPPLA